MDVKKLFILSLILPLSGCFVESMVVTSAAVSSADLYYTMTKKEAPIHVEGCGAFEKFKYTKNEFVAMGDGMQIQLLTHNQRYACECDHIAEACEDLEE